MDSTQFLNPPTILRPAPFWATNDRLTPEETARQMADMLRVGLSGGFFHSRMGLISEYLGEEWMVAMRAALQVAKEQGGYLWLYDEDCWPSGSAGGLVTSIKDEYRSTSLRAELLAPGEMPSDEADCEGRAAYLITRDGLTLTRCERIPYENLSAYPDSARLIFRRYYSPKIFGCWGWEACVNWLNPEAIQQFIAITHDAYYREFGDEFGKHIPGIFTDEPMSFQESWQDVPNAIGWYDGMAERYREWFGRDFWADVPYFCFDGPECRKIRLFIHRLILRQFVEAYSKQLYDWCERHGLAHTGHYNYEEKLVYQLKSHAGGIMAHYRYQHIPGVDQVGGDTPSHLLGIRQVGSAARQLGRPQVLSELFGGTGHTLTFEGFKSIGDYHLAHGVTFFCPHLTWYSSTGMRKRDFPPNWNYQQTYWDDLPLLNDYFTRIGYALSSGKAQTDILLLHPIENAAAGHRLGVSATVDPIADDYATAVQNDEELRWALDAILTAGYECDLGDEGYIEDLGAVEGDRFRIGEMSYAVVVVPPTRTWRPRTFDLLRQFTANGGKLIFLGEVPGELDCEPAVDAWQELAAQAQVVPCVQLPLVAALDACAPRSFSLRDAAGQPVPNTYLQHHLDGDQETFFIVNADYQSSRDYVLTRLVGADKSLVIWDPQDGTRKLAQFRWQEYRFTLSPVGSLLLVAESVADASLPVAQPLPDLSQGKITPLPDVWQYARSEENVLVLDRIRVSVEGGASWWEEMVESRARQRIAEHFDIAGALRCQPWAAIRKGLFTGKGGEVVLRYPFRCAVAPLQRTFLVIEHIEKGTVTVNGQPVEVSCPAWQWDRGFGKVEITGLLVPGENLVEFRVHYDFLTEVEAAYIVGDFGVRLVNETTAEITDEPDNLHNGSWVSQGFPFYSGRMRYQTTLPHSPTPAERTFLRLRNPSGILYRIRVNGVEVTPIFHQPYVAEITGELRDGANDIEIEVVASRQNTMGPIHGMRDELVLFDYGLVSGAEIVHVAR
ncbi:MAG: hypothetical protein ACYDBB_18155 [Armatimonadota bacterium]